MNVRHIALSALLIMTFVSGLSLAQDLDQAVDTSVNNTEVNASAVIEESVDEVVTEDEIEAADVEEPTDEMVTEDTTAAVETEETTDEMATEETIEAAEPAAEVPEAPSLEGIWIFNMDETQVTMVIYQEGDDLFGAAKSEDSEPWNAVMMGSISGDEVEINIQSLQNGALVSTKIIGMFSQDTIEGSFIKADSLGNVALGDTMGFKTGPDTSGYEPAAVAVVPTTAAVETTTPAVIDSGEETTTEEPEEEESRFVDVTSEAERIFTSGLSPDMRAVSGL